MAQGVTENNPLTLPKLDDIKPSLRLLKACRAHELSYDIRTFHLSDCPEYKALSYTWGSPFPPDQVTDPNGQRFPSDEDFHVIDYWRAESCTIRCNGSSVPVAQNLFEALSQLSALGEQGFMWIDRLSIDQSNFFERASQVALMGKIYRQAAVVIVWIGRGGKDSLAALEIQNNFAGPIFELVAEGKLSERDLEDHNPGDASYLTTFGLKRTMLDVWFAWTQFFRRSWFYRRWTLQETALASHIKVLCDNQELDWHKLQFLVRYFHVSGWKLYIRRYMSTGYQPTRAFLARTFIESALSDLQGWKSECLSSYYSFNVGTVFLEIFYRNCMLQCSDPRDMIFGILGIIENIMERLPELRDAHPIAVDYSKTKVIELYQAVVKRCIETIPDLDILSLVQDFSRRSISGLPSWIPDFYGMPGYVMEKRLELDRRQPKTPQYNVAFNSKSVPIHRFVIGNELQLKGCYSGKIIDCGVDFAAEDSTITAGDILTSLLRICNALPTVLRDRQYRVQALWRTIVSDSEGISRPAPAELSACFHDWILWLLFSLRASEKDWPARFYTICGELTKLFEQSQCKDSLPDVSMDSIWWKRLNDASTWNAYHHYKEYLRIESTLRFQSAAVLHHLVLFRTTEGDIGYGPTSSSLDDQIWVLENARVPFILRPTANASSLAVVGECYLHGVMDGQLLTGAPLEYVPLTLI